MTPPHTEKSPCYHYRYNRIVTYNQLLSGLLTFSGTLHSNSDNNDLKKKVTDTKIVLPKAEIELSGLATKAQ